MFNKLNKFVKIFFKKIISTFNVPICKREKLNENYDFNVQIIQRESYTLDHCNWKEGLADLGGILGKTRCADKISTSGICFVILVLQVALSETVLTSKDLSRGN